MTPLSSDLTLVLSSRNRHKLQEIRTILDRPRLQWRSLLDFPRAPSVTEDASTFAGNAAKKSISLAQWLAAEFPHLERTFVLADDSGLEVDALDGAPGVHSARFAAPSAAAGNASDEDNNAKLLAALESVPQERRTARFRCVIALTPVLDEGTDSPGTARGVARWTNATELFEGACEGSIARAPSGTGGFGYDPLFVPEGFSESFAELGGDAKNRISHRAQALAKLKSRLTKLLDD